MSPGFIKIGSPLLLSRDTLQFNLQLHSSSQCLGKPGRIALPEAEVKVCGDKKSRSPGFLSSAPPRIGWYINYHSKYLEMATDVTLSRRLKYLRAFSHF